MTTVTASRNRPEVARPQLPETVRSWPEWSDSLGFAGRDAVSFAAAWFEKRSEGRRRLVCSKDAEYDPSHLPKLDDKASAWLNRYERGDVEAPIRAVGPDGPIWVEPSTGEVVQAPPAGPGDLDRSYFVDTYSGESTHRTEASPLDYRIVITPGTVGLRVTDPRDTSDPPPFPELFFDEDGKVVKPATLAAREPITEFSAKSRTRLVRRLLSIPWGEYLEPGERIYVVTLTAPADHLAVFEDHTDGYKALRSFQDRLSYATGRKARGFWKLEFQRRGAPHGHLVLIAPRRVAGRRLTEWISHAWWEAVGSGVESHLLAGTNVDVERSVQASDALRLALYFAGYSTTKDKEYQHRVAGGGLGRREGFDWPVLGLLRREAGRRGSPYLKGGPDRGEAPASCSGAITAGTGQSG